MNIVITGATGYLGVRFAERLCQNHTYKILLTVRDESRLPEIFKSTKNISICNINADSLQNQMIKFDADVILSTTCCYELDTEYLYRTVDANYVFPAKLLEIAAMAKKKNVRFISLGTGLPSSLNLYSLTKRHFAELGNFFREIGKVEFINLALESFYGVNEPNNRFITKSITRLKANQELLLTEGTQKRDFIYIDDVIDVLLFFVESDTMSVNMGHIPVGTGVAPSIKEIILFLHEELRSGSSLRFGHVKMRENEPSTCADISVLRKLGYSKPFMHWRDGMRKVIGSVV
ncbi:MAG: NAD(P)-dependent oxidoreductase [Chitinispirillales bacterium]|jgi:CDP-paratose synthetase|nr:NAD(P)-dependent oxidoreductase [Chitinispirillales bacterium]